jgi:hypothetical protein
MKTPEEPLYPRGSGLNPDERLGIIRGVGYGMRDFGSKPGLWFSVYTSDSSVSLQCFWGEDADQIIKDARAYDVHELEGMPCWMQLDGGLCHFLKVAEMGRKPS